MKHVVPLLKGFITLETPNKFKNSSSKEDGNCPHTLLNGTSPNEGDTEHHRASEVTLGSSLWAVWHTNLYFNLAGLVFIPLGILSSFWGWSDATVFALNFCAIIPLAKMLDFATDQLSMR
ncbi:hypothetical protein BCR33DRAFT_792565 [Rhizoclosmatium globosum]|uniref:Uncharacterized protein n=1 Tax=Rhizoclosmatium globosum TaxID=329046 RepID=A0A1Y2B6I3_9FUNG|nr:hypothetical protein BCR33DRAFT_792565 [Rhizoclosmatium globosum]|eukprot:ORY30443.1 hypothetical protein BCR33DRAFT_792565 [Rhizoclosmatium globosum]